jgi:hypothetical protein
VRASEELNKRHREVPLGPAGDRIASVFASLVPLADAKLESMRQSGALVVGEITDPLPNAKTFHLPDDSFVIVMYSGLIDFYQYVCNTLMASSTMHSDGEVTSAALSMNYVIANLKQLFQAWTPDGLVLDRIPPVSLTSLPPSYAQITEMLNTMTLSFVLSHEFGHVQYYKPPRGAKPAPALTLAQEIKSDQAGSQSVLIASGPEGRGPARMSIAGIFVALRVLAVLADLGHKFGDDHPPPLDRLKAITSAIRGICNSEREYWSLSTIAYAYDERLQSAGAQAINVTPPRTFDHALSRLVSMLEEIVKGHTPPSELLPGMRMDFDDLSDEDLGVVAGMAAILFPSVPVSTNDDRQDKMWAAMGESLRGAIPQFPDRARAVFQFAFSPANQKKG